jgi:SAM-dependent methyltransferase
MEEQFKPVPHSAPTGWSSRVKFASRLLLDFQVRTVHRHVQAFLSGLTGNILDLGCGQSPYRHLLDPGANYLGMDFEGAENFEYKDQPDVTYFDGKHLPLPDASVDHVLCTEVLEHSPEPAALVQEVLRVMKPGATGLFSIPWSARYHYIPYDYFRYTPSMLKLLFKDFTALRIEPRGTEVTSIAAKTMVLALRPLLNGKRPSPGSLLSMALLAPLVPAALVAGHLSLSLGLGSADDPLGYTVWITR